MGSLIHNFNERFQFSTPSTLQPDLPLLVYLPGMDGTGELLRSQLNKGLSNAFNVQCLAMPAHDLSSWDQLTEKVVGLLRAQFRRSRPDMIYLCGESFGGCLALKIALHAPELFDRLILVNPASCFMSRPWLHFGSHLTGWLPPPVYALSVMGLLPFLAALGRIARSERNALLAAMQSVPQPTSTWRVNLLREFEIDSHELSRIRQPVLAIASTGDRLLPSPAEATRLTYSIPNAKQVLLPDSGHACLLETEVNLYKLLKDHDFLTHPKPISAVA
jgi:pimeloyl-ACP methyl ester carboxylesterase